MSALGGFVIGFAYYVTLLFRLDADTLEVSTSQWPLVLSGIFAGLFGSLIDSLLGATFQFSGKTNHLISQFIHTFLQMTNDTGNFLRHR